MSCRSSCRFHGLWQSDASRAGLQKSVIWNQRQNSCKTLVRSMGRVRAGSSESLCLAALFLPWDIRFCGSRREPFRLFYYQIHRSLGLIWGVAIFAQNPLDHPS